MSCGAGDTVGFYRFLAGARTRTRGLGFKALLKSAVERAINTEKYGKLNGQEADDYEFTYYRTFDQIVYGASSFDDTSFSINEGDKIGLIGINGTGKSTLLKIAAGLEELDLGTVVRGRNLYIRYLPQNPAFEPQLTVLECVIKENEGHEHVWDLEGQAKTC